MGWAWQCTLLIPALGRQRQVDLCETEASLDYIASSRPAGAIGRPSIKKTKKQNIKKKRTIKKN